MQPLILREVDVALTRWDDPVRGHVAFRTMISGDDTPTESLSCGFAYLQQGESLRLHRHNPPEIYVIHEGRPVVTIDGTEHQVEPGMCVFIPANAEHGIRNDGPEPVRFFYCFAVDRFSDVAYRFSSAS